jgi:hypothetical protein
MYGLSDELIDVENELITLKARWNFLMNNPENAQDMLLWLSEGKCDETVFVKMIDQLIEVIRLQELAK